MAFPRGEEVSLDDLRATSDFGGEELGGDDGAAGGDDGGPAGGELPGAGAPAGGSAPVQPAEERGGDRRLHDLTQAVNQYRDEARTLKQEREVQRAELAELRAWRAEVQAAIRAQREEVVRAQREEAARAQAAADPEPDPILESEKHAEWQRRQDEAKFEAAHGELRGELKMTREQLAQQQQQMLATQLESQLDGFTNRFRAQQPDYDQAFEFLANTLANHFRTLGYSEEEIFAEGTGALWRERDRYLRSCLEVNDQTRQVRWKPGVDPAAGLYAAAVAYGWGRNGAAAPAGTQPPAGGRRPAAPAQRRPSRAPALANAAAAAAGAGGGAGAAGEPLTAERLVNLNPREYAYLLHKRPDLVESILRSVS